MKAIYFLSVIFVLFLHCGSSQVKEHSVVCNEEYSFQQIKTPDFHLGPRYDLQLVNSKTGEEKMITDNVAVLPAAKWFLDRIQIYFTEQQKKCDLFTCHYMNPEIFSKKEFDLTSSCYQKTKDQFPLVRKKVLAFIYGDSEKFRQHFFCEKDFVLSTNLFGDIIIFEKKDMDRVKHFAETPQDHVGKFNTGKDLVFYSGKIVSDEVKGFFGRPVKKVMIKEKRKEIEKELQWVDLLYNNQNSGVNMDFIQTCKNKKNQTVEEFLGSN
ncbi:MAG: hypothetical protein OEZ34_01525 [Spirochaetia bacterium]|nr:hypothetical protein [Spirochaetia bacterium]